MVAVHRHLCPTPWVVSEGQCVGVSQVRKSCRCDSEDYELVHPPSTPVTQFIICYYNYMPVFSGGHSSVDSCVYYKLRRKKNLDVLEHSACCLVLIYFVSIVNLSPIFKIFVMNTSWYLTYNLKTLK